MVSGYGAGTTDVFLAAIQIDKQERIAESSWFRTTANSRALR
jgi:hypothetical protein